MSIRDGKLPKLRNDLMAREQFDTLLAAKVLIERWRRDFNAVRTHSSLGYRAPAPEAIQPASIASATPQRSKPIPNIPNGSRLG